MSIIAKIFELLTVMNEIYRCNGVKEHRDNERI